MIIIVVGNDKTLKFICKRGEVAVFFKHLMPGGDGHGVSALAWKRMFCYFIGR